MVDFRDKVDQAYTDIIMMESYCSQLRELVRLSQAFVPREVIVTHLDHISTVTEQLKLCYKQMDQDHTDYGIRGKLFGTKPDHPTNLGDE